MMRSVAFTKHPTSIFFQAALPNKKPAVDGTQYLRDLEASASQGQDGVYFAPQRVEVPNTPLRTAKKSIWRGLGSITGMAVLTATSLLGWFGIGASPSQWPHNVVSQHRKVRPQIKPHWDALFEVTQAAGRTNGISDPELKGLFAQKLTAVQYRMQEYLKKNPGLLNDKLLQKLNQSNNFLPDREIPPFIQDFLQFMQVELSKQGVPKFEAPADYQIEKIDIQDGFIAKNSVFKKLSPQGQKEFAQALQSVYKSNRVMPSTGPFRDAFYGAYTTGFTPLQLKDFPNLKNEKDAIRLWTAMVNENYKDLPDADRTALITEGGTILSALTSPAWDFALAALFYLSELGLLGIGILDRKALFSLVKACAVDLPQSLTKPTVVVNQVSLNSPLHKANLNQLGTAVQQIATDMATLIRNTYQSNDAFRTIHQERFPTPENLPTANDIAKQYFFETQQALGQQQTYGERWKEARLDEIQFIQELLERLQNAYEEGDYSILGLSKDTGFTEAAPKEIPADLPLMDALRLKRQQLETELKKAKLVRSKVILQASKAQQEYEAANHAIAELTKKMESAKKQIVDNPFLEANEALKNAQENKQKYEQLLQTSERSLSHVMATYYCYLQQVKQAMTQTRYADTVDGLTQFNDVSEQVLADPTLQTVLEKAEYQEALVEAKAALAVDPVFQLLSEK